MSLQPHSHSPDQAIPVANCIRCNVGMRLAVIEIATCPGVDTFIFACTCGYSIRLPVHAAADGDAAVTEGEPVTRKGTDKSGTVMELRHAVKVNREGNRTSYYSRDQQANVRAKWPKQ